MNWLDSDDGRLTHLIIGQGVYGGKNDGVASKIRFGGNPIERIGGLVNPTAPGPGKFEPEIIVPFLIAAAELDLQFIAGETTLGRDRIQNGFAGSFGGLGMQEKW